MGPQVLQYAVTKHRKRATIVAVVVTTVGLASMVYREHLWDWVRGGTKDQRMIAEHCRQYIYDCEEHEDEAFFIRGTCLIWNLNSDRLHRVHRRLPNDMAYTNGEGEVTVFFVTDTRSQKTGEYFVGNRRVGTSAYLKAIEVYVVMYSEDKAYPLGRRWMVRYPPYAVPADPRPGSPAPSSRSADDPTDDLVVWIQSLEHR